MSKRKLKKALKKAERLRDEWCNEYTLARDDLWVLKSMLARLWADGGRGAA